MAENISMILENYTNDLCKIYGNHLKKIILYGSYARGDNRKDSDIDIMILVDLQDEQMEALSDVLSELDFAENGTKEDLVMHRLAVAREDLDTAYILLDLKKYRGANNRAYYAIYHTIDAVLAQEGKQLLELAEHYLRDQKDVSE